MNEDYAGDISPGEAWRLLSEDPEAVLVDVRTDAEWTYVGLPDLSTISKEPLKISWQIFPAMQVDARFLEKLTHIDRGVPVLLLCRSGVRSKAAAKALTGVGYKRAYNISDGFEGAHDSEKHRGRVSGWKADGLPWAQG